MKDVMRGRVCFTKKNIEDCYWDSGKSFDFVFIPKKWWSVKQWKQVISFRRDFVMTGMISKERGQE